MPASIVDQIIALGTEFNANQYKLVQLAADYDIGLEWFNQGFESPATVIARALGIHSSTAREWIRVGHAINYLPLIDEAFRTNTLSYAKVRIVTRRADEENEHELLEIAHERSANRLTTAINKHLSGDETDSERDQRHDDIRSVTTFTDPDGMIIIRAALPPSAGKQVVEALNTIMAQVAATPLDDIRAFDETVDEVADQPAEAGGASADAYQPLHVNTKTTLSGEGASADAPLQPSEPSMAAQIRHLKQRWRPAGSEDDYWTPSLNQQRADAFMLLFLGLNIELTTEVVIHVRGDGNTFDDGTPITSNAICQRLDQSFVRALIHDDNRTPIDATNRRRHPTTRQKRVVLEAHNHECIDCQSTELLELDHVPDFNQTGHTVTTELEPRCAPCHRARHRRELAVLQR